MPSLPHHQHQRHACRAKQHRNGDGNQFLLRDAFAGALPAVREGGGLFYVLAVRHVTNGRFF